MTRDVDFNDAFAFDEVEVREDGLRFSDARFAEMALEHAAGNEDEHAFFDAAHDEAEWDARFGAAARAAGVDDDDLAMEFLGGDRIDVEIPAFSLDSPYEQARVH